LLTITDMASVIGVSRMTYHTWCKGKPMRLGNDIKVRNMLGRLLTIMTDKGWPSPDIIILDQAGRKKKLLEYLEEYH